MFNCLKSWPSEKYTDKMYGLHNICIFFSNGKRYSRLKKNLWTTHLDLWPSGRMWSSHPCGVFVKHKIQNGCHEITEVIF